MKNNVSIIYSETDREFLHNTKDEDIDLSEIPEISEEQMARAVVRVGGKTVSKGKVRVNMYLDADIVTYYKRQAGGRGYQTLINAALRESIGAQNLESLLRRIIQEELSTKGLSINK